MLRLSLLLLLLVAIALVPVPLFAAACELSGAPIFTPSSPTEDRPVTVKIRGVCPNCAIAPGQELSRSGSVFFFKLPYPADGHCAIAALEWEKEFNLGRLRAGTYSAVVQLGAEISAPRTFTVGKAAFEVTPGFGSPGTEVLLVGPGIGLGTTQVIFGTAFVTSFRVLDANRIIAVVPPGGGVVTITIAQGSKMIDAVDVFDYFTPPRPFSRVLFPLAFSGPGAFGSSWRTDNVIRNKGVVPLTIASMNPIPANTRVTLPTFATSRGLIVGIATDQLADASFASHARDISRSALDAGTELRVVTEERTASELRIVNVPLESRYRYLLRVYDIDSFSGREVRVTATNADGTRAGESTVTLNAATFDCITQPCINNEPAFAAIDLRDVVPAASGPVNVTVSSAGARLWAFISATNNDTQHVTTYTPQR